MFLSFVLVISFLCLNSYIIFILYHIKEYNTINSYYIIYKYFGINSLELNNNSYYIILYYIKVLCN